MDKLVLVTLTARGQTNAVFVKIAPDPDGKYRIDNSLVTAMLGPLPRGTTVSIG